MEFALDFDEWLGRSTAGPEASQLIAACLAARPERAAAFAVSDSESGRRLTLRYSLTRWRRPPGASSRA